MRAMYIVRWCGHDGGQRELPFHTLADARTEAAALDLRFDGVEILGRDGKRLWPKERKCPSAPT